jgi:hypothetical protein
MVSIHGGLGDRQQDFPEPRPGRWTQLWTQTRREPQGYEGTKARPWPHNLRLRVTGRDHATPEGTRIEVFETAPNKRQHHSSATYLLRLNG